ncbi:MAG: hypothetical protein ACKVS9_13500 [Phycisphaerae bacterium]
MERTWIRSDGHDSDIGDGPHRRRAAIAAGDVITSADRFADERARKYANQLDRGAHVGR